MRKKVTAIFDIGKTNKKFFIFDNAFQELEQEYTVFPEIVDEDGHAGEDLNALISWVKEVWQRHLTSEKYEIIKINFSCYGASLVHLDEQEQVLFPFYNYTKPIDKRIANEFYQIYGSEEDLWKVTGSPRTAGLDLLNSGIQLYWLKKKYPKKFAKIKYSLHFPQFISYLFSDTPLTEYTSIGCHTLLWDYTKSDYHSWVYNEGIHTLFPPLTESKNSHTVVLNGKAIAVGVGIHDSSASLIPYLRCVSAPFILLSTGTWCVALNPFEQEPLFSDESLKSNCINYMGVKGEPVKSSRLFLGHEYSVQVERLSKHFKVTKDYDRTIRFDKQLVEKILSNFQPTFRWETIVEEEMPTLTRLEDISFEVAYHRLMIELVKLQVKSILAVRSEKEKINQLFVDGGFADNEVYVKLLAIFLPDMTIRKANSAIGAALGAAMVLSKTKLGMGFMESHYSLETVRS